MVGLQGRAENPGTDSSMAFYAGAQAEVNTQIVHFPGIISTDRAHLVLSKTLSTLFQPLRVAPFIRF
jgi:hypothetical protein